MKRKAIALLRVSSDAQAGEDRLGLPAQRRKCERIAETNGLDIADGDWVTLKGVSCRGARRPEVPSPSGSDGQP